MGVFLISSILTEEFHKFLFVCLHRKPKVNYNIYLIVLQLTQM